MNEEMIDIDQHRSGIERMGIKFRRSKNESAIGRSAVDSSTEDSESNSNEIPFRPDWTDGGNPYSFEPGRAVRVIPEDENTENHPTESTTQNVSDNNVISIDP